MPKPRGRKRIGLTIDPDIWERCQTKSKLYGVNWSLVAEQAFSVLLLQLENLEAVLASSNGDNSSSVLKASLKAYLADQFAHSYKEIEQLYISRSETLSESQ